MEARQFLSNNNFKHLIMTISVKTCGAMWREEMWKNVLKEWLLKCFMEECAARKTVDECHYLISDVKEDDIKYCYSNKNYDLLKNI